jgi:CRP-like cAMP-binding protein
MNPFVERISTYAAPLSVDAQIDVTSHVSHKVFRKGDIINNQGAICKKLYFIEKGLVKHYYYHNGKRFVIRFFSEGSFFTVLDSFIAQAPADFTTVALEETTVHYLDYEEVERLSKTHHSFDTFIRILYASAAMHNLQRIKDMFNNDASALYQRFVASNPELVQRITLGDIAGYLGISQVSLSRIRSSK